MFRINRGMHYLLLILSLIACSASRAAAQEPPALNPFGPPREDRDDALPGYLETSDGKVHPGNISMTRDKRLKLYDAATKRQREIPLRAVKQIECKVLKEWMEKEWRFKETTSNEKYYTGREYPARECEYTITLSDGRTLVGPLAEILYVRPIRFDPTAPMSGPARAELERFLLNKRQKGDFGTDLKSLVYVKLVKLGQEALAEGRQKAGQGHASAGSGDPR